MCLGRNVAEGRSARQNSNYEGREAKRAVDGNPVQNLMYGSCSQTGAESPSWWEVDFGNAYVIKGIRIYSTTTRRRCKFKVGVAVRFLELRDGNTVPIFFFNVQRLLANRCRITVMVGSIDLS